MESRVYARYSRTSVVKGIECSGEWSLQCTLCERYVCLVVGKKTAKFLFDPIGNTDMNNGIASDVKQQFACGIIFTRATSLAYSIL